MATEKGGRKKETTNLKIRQKQWDNMREDAKRATKRPGSNKK